MLNGLDLFSGIGGISLGLQKWVKPIAYCEFDPYCQSVLLSRMDSGDLINAPIWDDIKTLKFSKNDSKACDIIYGGFPCQDISIAGNGKGLAGERSGLFYEMLRLAEEIKPSFIFIENVPAITCRGGLQVVNEIASLGYDCRWCVISSASVGAPHKRNRWFMLAHTNSKSSRETDTITKPIQDKEKTWIRSTRQTRGNESQIYWEKDKSPIFGMDDGIPDKLDRSKSLGNSVVPQQVEEAFKILMGLND